MNDIRTVKQKRDGQSSILPSPRTEGKLGRIPEKDLKLKPTDNMRSFIRYEQNTEQLPPQSRLGRQNTNLSTVNWKRQPNKKPKLPVPFSQKLNQLLIGKEALTGNKMKDVESSYRQFEELYMETLPKMGYTEEAQGISFLDLFRDLVKHFEKSNSEFDEMSSKNKDLEEKVSELEKRIKENSDFYYKELVKLKNQIDEMGVENQRLTDKNERLKEENRDQSDKINSYHAQIDQAAKISKVVCPECKMISQENPTIRDEASGNEEEIKQHSSNDRVSYRNSTRDLKSDSTSEKLTALQLPLPLIVPTTGLLGSPMSTPRDFTPRNSTPTPQKDHRRIKTPQQNSPEMPSQGHLTQQEDPWTSRSNTEFSFSSSHISFANKSASSLSGHSSRESSELSFANSPSSL